MAHLQRVESQLNGKTYIKYQMVVPANIVDQLGWQPGNELNFAKDRNGKLVVGAHQPNPKSKKLSYEEFREAVHIALSSADGLTWSEIRKTNSTLPVKPNALWVRRLEGDIGLKRVMQPESGRRTWSTAKP